MLINCVSGLDSNRDQRHGIHLQADELPGPNSTTLSDLSAKVVNPWTVALIMLKRFFL